MPVLREENMSSSLSEEQLEQALEMLALAINKAGPEKEMLLLSKLCFVLADKLADLGQLEEAIEMASKEL